LGLTKCGSCGFPRLITVFLGWEGNGAITVKRMPVFRVVLIEADFFTVLLDSLEKGLGLSVRHVAFEAQRHSLRHAISHVLDSPLRVLARGKHMKKLMARIFCRVAQVTGTSYARVISYEPGQFGEAIIHNPFDKEMMASIILSAFEAMEGVPFEHNWSKRGADDIISVRPALHRSDIDERMEYVPLDLKTSKRQVQTCQSCGTPSAMRHLKWHSKKGIVTDERHGTRFVILDASTPEVIIRELVKELGEDFYPLIVEAYRDFSLPHIRREYLGDDGAMPDRDTLYARALEAMAARGQGSPVFWSTEGERLEVVVENPFETHLLGGFFAALYEAAEGKRARAVWSCPDSLTAVYTIEP
jgi:ribosomal protein L37E